MISINCFKLIDKNIIKNIIKIMTFDEWIWKVCERYSIRYRTEPHEIYSIIDLFDAKLSFMDGVRHEEYKIS